MDYFVFLSNVVSSLLCRLISIFVKNNNDDNLYLYKIMQVLSTTISRSLVLKTAIS